MFANRRNSCVLQEIKIEEYDGDVKFQTRGFRPEVEIRHFLTEKMCNITLIYGRITEISVPHGNNSVGHNGLSYEADTTFHRTHF